MKRTRKLTFLLVIALISTMAFCMPKALAASVPDVTVSSSTDLLDAIENASDGAVIGIDGQITFDASMILGDDSKKSHCKGQAQTAIFSPVPLVLQLSGI